MAVLLALVVLGTASLQAETLTWLGGNGAWTNGQATHWAGGAVWQNDDSAVFHATPGTVTLSSDFMDIGDISIADGYTFTGGLVSATVHSLRFVTPGSGTGLTLRNQVQLSMTSENGIIGGNFHLMDSTYLTAETTSAITGGNFYLNNNSTFLASYANSTTKQVNVHFDTNSGGTGGHLQLAGISTTVGQLVSAGPAAAGIIENTSSTAAHLTTDFDTAIATFNGSIRDGSGTLSLTKAGTGTLILANDLNTYTGGTTLKGGILAVMHDSSLGNAGTSVTFDGGTLQANAGVTMIHAFDVASGGGVVNTNGHDMAMFTLGGSGDLTKTGNGALTLIGDNSYYSGHLTISAGSFEVFGGKALHIGSGGTSGAITGNVINNGLISFNRSDNSTYAEVMSGTGGISKSGGGTLTLTNHNTFTGAVQILGGTLNLANASAIGSASSIDFGGGVLQFGTPVSGDYSTRFLSGVTQHYRIDTNGHSTTMEANLSGPASTFEKLGAGELTLRGANSFSGGVTLSGGVLSLESAAALGSSGTILFNGGTLNWRPLAGVPTQDYSGRFSAAANQVFRLANEFDNTPGYFSQVTLGGNLTSVGGSLEKSGTGLITLTGNNSYSNGTILRQGILAINGDSNIGSGGITLDGGTLRVLNGGSLSSARNYHATSNGGLVEAAGAHAQNFISDAGGSTTFTGGLSISGSATIYGALTAQSLTMGNGLNLQVGNGSVGSLHTLGALTMDGGTFTVNSAQNTTVGGGLHGTGTLEKWGTGTLQLLGAGNFTGTTHLHAGVIELGGVGALGVSSIFMNSGTIRASSAVSIENSLIIQSGGVIDTAGYDSTLASFTGTGLLRKIGAGQLLIVGGSNAFNGHLSVDEGTLRIFNTSTLQIGTGGTSGVLTGNVIADGYLAFNRSDAVSYAGAISGSGGVRVLGTGTTTLSGSNSYTGGTYIQNGALMLTNSQSAGSGAIVNDGHLLLNGNMTLNMEISGSGQTVADGGLVTITSSNTYSGGFLVKSGTTTLTGDNVFSGGLMTDSEDRGTIVLTGNNDVSAGITLGPGRVVLGSANALGSTGNIVMNGGTLVYTEANTTNYYSRIDRATSRSVGFDTNGLDISMVGDFNFAYDFPGFRKEGAGTLSLYGTSNVHFLTVAGGTLAIFNDTGVISAEWGTISLTSADAVLDLRGVEKTYTHNRGPAFGGLLTEAGSTVLGDFVTNAGEVKGNIIGKVVKASENWLVLSGSNQMDLTIEGGVVQVDHADAIEHGSVSFSNTLQLSGTLATTVDVSLGTVGTGGWHASFDVLAGTTLSVQRFSEQGELKKMGAGKLILGSAAPGDMGIILHGGTIEVLDGNSLGNKSLWMDSNTNFTLKNSGAYSGNIDGGGTFTFSGTGLSTYTGRSDSGVSVVVQGGTLLSSGAGEILGHVTNQGTLAFNYDNDRTHAGVVSGTGTLVKQGSSTLIMTGSNTYTGATAVSGGTLRLDTNTASPIFAMAASAVLDLHVAAGQTDYHSVTGTTTFLGQGTLRKTGAGTAYWGAVAGIFAMEQGSLIDVQQGTLFGGSNANENWTANQSSLYVAAGAAFHGVEANVRVDALDGAGTIRSGYTGSGYQAFTFGVANGSGTFDGVLADTVGYSGHFVKTGTGTQILTGANTYTGGTTINGGTLVVNGSIASGAIVQNGGALGGSGVIHGNVIVENGATLAPGNSPGLLTIEGDLTLNNTSILQMEFASTSLYDQIDVHGLFTAAGILNFIILDGYTPVYGDTFTIFTGALPGAGSFTLNTNLGGGLQWDLSRMADEGIVEVVPEPSTWALLGLGGIALFLTYRRRERLYRSAL